MLSDKPLLTKFYAVKYWPVWLGLSCLRIIIILPWAWRMKMGRAIGRLLYQLSARRRLIAETNVGLCFGHLTASEQRYMIRQIFADNGIGIVETAMAWWSARDDLHHRVSIEGGPLIEEAQAQGRGVILVGAHFTLSLIHI